MNRIEHSLEEMLANGFVRLDTLANDLGIKMIHAFMENHKSRSIVVSSLDVSGVDEIFQEPWVDYKTDVEFISGWALSDFVYEQMQFNDPTLQWWNVPVVPDMERYLQEIDGVVQLKQAEPAPILIQPMPLGAPLTNNKTFGRPMRISSNIDNLDFDGLI